LKELNNGQLGRVVEVSLNRLSGDDRRFILRLIEKMRKVDVGEGGRKGGRENIDLPQKNAQILIL